MALRVDDPDLVVRDEARLLDWTHARLTLGERPLGPLADHVVVLVENNARLLDAYATVAATEDRIRDALRGVLDVVPADTAEGVRIALAQRGLAPEITLAAALEAVRRAGFTVTLTDAS